MTACKCWATALVAMLLLPNVAASADPATEACQEGRSCLRIEDFDSAISAYTEAIRLDPKLAKAYGGRGFAYCEKGDFDRAIADYTQAIRLEPKFAVAYWGRGLAYRRSAERQGHWRLHGSRPTGADVCRRYCDRAVAYQDKGEHDKAIGDYTEALRLEPKLTDAYYNRGIAYRKKGKHDKAIADFTEAIRLRPQDAEAYRNRGTTYWRKGDYDKAFADYTEAIRLNPEDAEAYHSRGLAYEKKGQKLKAEEDFAQAKKLGYKGK